MKYIGIYKITNLKNNKVYIGSSQDLKARLRCHRHQLKKNIHGNTHLQYSYNKYGVEAFRFEIIEITNKNDLIEREIFWIKLYNCLDRDKGYNKASNIINSAGNKWSEESKRKLSNSKKGMKMHPNTKKALQEANKKRVYDCSYLYTPENVKKSAETRKIPILQYDLKGNFIREWDSSKSASEFYQINSKGISACCRGERFTCGKYQWFLKPKNNLYPTLVSKYQRCSKNKTINDFLRLCSEMSNEKFGELLENPEMKLDEK